MGNGYLLTTKWLAEETEAASVLAPMSVRTMRATILAQRTVIDACELVSAWSNWRTTRS